MKTKEQVQELVSANFIRIRRHFRYTQFEVAEALDVNPKTIASYEEKRAMPPIHILLNFCSLFRVDIERMLTSEVKFSRPRFNYKYA